MTAPDKYFVRFSTAADHQKIMDFYELNAHKNVRKRQSDLVQKLADTGAVILIEDAQGKIVASSITYPHKVTDPDGVERVKWQEIGSTRIVLNGYPGFFDIMVSLQTLRAFLVEPPEDCFVAQMHTTAVQKMAERHGWRRFSSAPQKLMDAKRTTVDLSDTFALSVQNWYAATRESLPYTAKLLCNAIDQPCLTHTKTGNKIQIDFSKSNFLSLFGTDIRELAKKSYGSPDTPDRSKGLLYAHRQWMQRRFR